MTKKSDRTKAHEPMLKYIRENVKRPDHLPYSNPPGNKFLRFKGYKCPMALLHPCKPFIIAPVKRQHFTKDFPIGLSDSDIMGFYSWWDQQTDPKLAVEAIWGKK